MQDVTLPVLGHGPCSKRLGCVPRFGCIWGRGAYSCDARLFKPTKLDLVMNVKAAKAIGLTIPPIMLTRADEVIE